MDEIDWKKRAEEAERQLGERMDAAAVHYGGAIRAAEARADRLAATVLALANEMGDGVSPECSGFADRFRAALAEDEEQAPPSPEPPTWRDEVHTEEAPEWGMYLEGCHRSDCNLCIVRPGKEQCDGEDDEYGCWWSREDAAPWLGVAQDDTPTVCETCGDTGLIPATGRGSDGYEPCPDCNDFADRFRSRFDPQGDDVTRVCETCGGTGEIDMFDGLEGFFMGAVPCPDCTPTEDDHA